MDLLLLVTLAILAVVSVIAYNGLKNKQKIDSPLRQRAVFNSHELMTYTRIQEILPSANILAHVSFDALLTTKYLHTRRKYQKMFADFVVLDHEFKVIAVITLDDPNVMKWMNTEQNQDTLLEMAGYRVIRYQGVPEYQQLREDFMAVGAQSHETLTTQPAAGLEEYAERLARPRVFG
ncbi:MULTISPECIES: DUF2726 domain-containing protein [Acinetobacter]|uniref:DUF2726 domain-containing protein n=1 Tax=Acinetobacter piscicola TaxID=2006115 RepID=A0A7S6VU01_9GAMM|nr:MULTISPECIES: DUF2726 domain-containing protein [Acinetobacter]MDM1757875.1 DUF2726 domain-containing protein [Acinetobacter sp. 256-1]MDM1761290.1 DUF2726 domain-containing protein [Acinetobacter sp. 251-1]QOW44657.1 DUF2726 domain-containing protein [Acinetobacter piscicola]